MARSAIPLYTTNQLITAAHGNTYWRDNEAAHWAAIQGGMVLIETIEVAIAAANIDFTTIPATYDHLRLVLNGRGTNASTNEALYLTFNADGGANYDRERLTANAAAAAVTETLAQTSGAVGNLPSATATAGLGGSITVDFPDYKGTAYEKTYIALGASKPAEVAGGIFIYNICGYWRSAAAIDQITLTLGAGNFDVDTIASLYGLG